MPVCMYICTHTHSLKHFIFPGIPNEITLLLGWGSNPAKTQTGI